MKILGIETSCDETAAAVIKDGREVFSNVVASSLDLHSKYGGVIPEIASRRQLEYINSVVNQALDLARTDLKDIDAIAVTAQPGLIGSLLVGLSFARALGYAQHKPVVEVDHIKAHLYANFLRQPDEIKPPPTLPAIGLVVSGGHTSLYAVEALDEYRLLGQTRDDAAGEAFDKVAKILGLGYPGGPAIDRLAQKGKNSHIRFTCAPLPDTLDFSFSGIKTAVLYYTRDNQHSRDYSPAEVAYSFQDSIVNLLTKKCLDACARFKSKSLMLGGGVAANSLLRRRLLDAAQQKGIEVHIPPVRFCLDNAAMIGGLGFHQLKKTVQHV